MKDFVIFIGSFVMIGVLIGTVTVLNGQSHETCRIEISDDNTRLELVEGNCPSYNLRQVIDSLDN